ncbi:MAG: GNAT family N-acetyltransferase [Desulfovibrionaceae bacterium]
MMVSHDPMAIERTSALAWPTLEQLEISGWTLRFSHGYTKRSNSAWLLRETSDAHRAIADIESAYLSRGLNPIFKVTGLLAPEIDATLAERGYRLVDTTLVMTLPLNGSHPATAAPACDLHIAGNAHVQAWFEHWKACAGSPSGNGSHLALLRRTPQGTLFGCVRKDRQPGSCGLGVPSNGFPDPCGLFGIYDVATRPDLRRRGLGTALVTGLLEQAVHLGAHTAYLQVVETNIPARSLYSGLGFAEAYRYWYRVRT